MIQSNPYNANQSIIHYLIVSGAIKHEASIDLTLIVEIVEVVETVEEVHKTQS